jgi:hypothetical protein
VESKPSFRRPTCRLPTSPVTSAALDFFHNCALFRAGHSVRTGAGMAAIPARGAGGAGGSGSLFFGGCTLAWSPQRAGHLRAFARLGRADRQRALHQEFPKCQNRQSGIRSGPHPASGTRSLAKPPFGRTNRSPCFSVFAISFSRFPGVLNVSLCEDVPLGFQAAHGRTSRSTATLRSPAKT